MVASDADAGVNESEPQLTILLTQRDPRHSRTTRTRRP